MQYALPLVATLLLSGAGCAKEDASKGKLIDDLKVQVKQGMEREQNLKQELDQLTKKVTQLQNDFKTYSQNPCDFELDPVDYAITRKDPGAASTADAMTPPRPAAPDMTPDMKPDVPDAPPAELAEVPKRIRAARYNFKACYQDALKKNVSLQGGSQKVTLKFTVVPAGQVTKIMIVPPIGGGFEDCVRRTLSSWSFARFAGAPRAFSQPMTLRPQ
jgi:hypothetical protein